MTKSIPQKKANISEANQSQSRQNEVPRGSHQSEPPEHDPSSPKTKPSPLIWRILRLFAKPRLWLLLLLVAGIGKSVLWLQGERDRILAELPDPQKLLSYAQPGSYLIKAADDSILLRQGSTIPQDLPLTEMPPQLIEAFLAAEDQRFYEHKGVDYPSIVRAMVANLRAGEIVEGGSTLTQQLVRIVFLNQEQSFERKIREALMAQQVEAAVSKEKVLERYLNLVYLGGGAYGVTDAAWIYFSKTPQELSLGEMALLAAMPPAPSVYSPLINLEVAQRERNKVLGRMEELGYISAAEAQQARAEAVALNPAPPQHSESPSPYFTSHVQKELDRLVEQDYLDPEVLAQGGLTIETTLNPAWQALAEETVQWIVNRDGYYERFEQAAFVVIDPRTGGIPVMIGGMDYQNSEFNRVTQAYRQPGSTFKTFVYTAAIAAGFSPYKGYDDLPITVDGYTPKNYGGRFRGSLSLRDALTYSVNTIALRTLLDVGFEPVINVSQDMGIESELQGTYSLSLGAWEVTLLELTSAYGTLANQGVHVAPHGISRILDRQGEVVFEASSYAQTPAIDGDTAAIMTWMLESVVREGTGSAAKLDRPVAGKTGTSEKARDLWFVGYTPQYVAGVWLGNDDNSPTWGSSGTAAYLWGEVMHELLADVPVEDFPPLPELSNRQGSIAVDPVQPRSLKVGRQADAAARQDFDASTSGENTSDTGLDYAEDTFEETANSEDTGEAIAADETETEPFFPDLNFDGEVPSGIPWSGGDQPVVDPIPVDPVDETLPPPLDEPPVAPPVPAPLEIPPEPAPAE